MVLKRDKTGQIQVRQFGFSIQSLLNSTVLIRGGCAGLLGLALAGTLAATPAFAVCAPPGRDNLETPGCAGLSGGGGGAGTQGGAGGANSDGDLPAQGGQTAGAAGDNGASSSLNNGNGGGGGGGAHGYVGTDLPTAGSIGGAGGRGGDGGLPSGFGGSGGSGGYGAVVTGTGGTLSVNVIGGAGGVGGGASGTGTAGDGGRGGVGMYGVNQMDLTIDATVKGGRGGNGGAAIDGTGGMGADGREGLILANGGSVTINGAVKGGDGGNGGASASSVGGNGGVGGNGITVNSGGASITVNAGAEVTGGNVGNGGLSGGSAGMMGGTGIVGQDLTIINNGTISGGLNGDGSRANAVTFIGGTNVYEMWASASVTGSVVDMNGTGTFRLGGTANGTFDLGELVTGQYQGFTHLEKSGTSTWTLNNSSGWTSDVAINGGTLFVQDTLANASLVTVNATGTLAGTGPASAVQVNAGGTFAPGNGTPGSSMTVASLAMQSGAQFLVSVSPTASSFANVTGDAALGGATVATNFATASGYVAKQYTILTAGSITGSFNSTVQNTNLPSGFKTALSYDATHTQAYLDLTLDFTSTPGGGTDPGSGSGSGPTPPATPKGLTGNQSSAGNAIINYFNTNGSIPMAFGALTPQGLTQVSGEVGNSGQHTSSQSSTQFINVMSDPTAAGRGGGVGGGGAMGYADDAMAYARKKKSNNPRDAFASFTKAPPGASLLDPRWSVWAMGFGGSQTTDGNVTAGTNTSSSSIYGVAVGADYRFSPDTIAGFAFAGGGTNYSVVNGGTGRSDMFQAGAFVRQNFGATYLTASAAYGWQDVTTDRYITVAGVDHLRAEFNTNSYSGRLELGHRFLSPWFGGLGVSPYAAAQITAFELPAYAERAISGASTFALAYNAQTSTATRSELGLRTDKAFALEGAVLTLRGRAAWAHDFNPNSAVAATFQSLPGASFVVNGASLSPDSALTTASAEVSWLNGWSVAGTFEGEFSDVTRSYAGKGVVRYNW